ncbi:MAG TPA: hypothetical protein DDY70_07195 [Clostridiales bacterium]|nr:hypothetical protein [Clostridiales bacterium]
MVMEYNKLWKLLVDKKMTKADLMETTGISSRVIAKLVQGDTVTTDTLLRICEALGCDIGDICECVSEEKLSLYDAYRTCGKVVGEEEEVRIVSFEHRNRRYTVYVSKKRTTKATRIECREDETIYWIQYYPFGSMCGPSQVETIFLRPKPAKDETRIVLFRGKPGVIVGLDEGIFVSAHGTPRENTVYVMSEGAFKLFATKKTNN